MYTVTINNHAYHVDADSLTGAQIKALAAATGVQPDYELFLVHTPGSGPPEDKSVANDQTVPIRNGMKFRALPAGNRG